VTKATNIRSIHFALTVAAPIERLVWKRKANKRHIDLPEEEQIRHILLDSYIAECNDVHARMGLDSATDLIGRRMAEMVVTDDSKNSEPTRQFIRAGYRVLHRKSYEVDMRENHKVFLNSMTGIVVKGKLIATWGR
jgi:hypothetical protein